MPSWHGAQCPAERVLLPPTWDAASCFTRSISSHERCVQGEGGERSPCRSSQSRIVLGDWVRVMVRVPVETEDIPHFHHLMSLMGLPVSHPTLPHHPQDLAQPSCSAPQHHPACLTPCNTYLLPHHISLSPLEYSTRRCYQHDLSGICLQLFQFYEPASLAIQTSHPSQPTNASQTSHPSQPSLGHWCGHGIPLPCSL